ncbi:hypothetical protein LC1Nh_0918 [Candidatus Nanohalobium constans]|uniref:Alpha-galactosidase NEW3 domain-containing protein n=2 Tax=Candidatus Nanohalobium constans TaxID=2565781 RepID=A0A5Q0UHY3_9ARCH|nr:hypothetical protein LC1Nh_0918 [Candidatus Nanohalobium constans]
MNFQKLTILATLILATTTLAAASQAEITVFPSESSTRIDSFTSYEATIENVGPVEDTYTFTSSNNEEIDIAPQRVTLGAGQEETVNVWYNPSQDREEGTYSFSVTAESRATGSTYNGEIVATVIREHDVEMEVDRNSQTVCRGQTATYDVEVTNNGIQQEEFQLSTDQGTLSQNTVTLEDGETKQVTLTTKSDTETNQNFNLRATSTTSYAQDIENMQFNVETCYSSETSVTPTEQETAGGTTAEFDVTIRNTGTQEDEFTLSANTGEFTENPVEVDGETTETVQLEVTPEELGKNKINIEAKGRSSTSTTATLKAYNGNDMEITYPTQSVNVCENERAEVQTNIENTGETTETFNLETNRGTLQTQEAEIQPGETAEITTLVDATTLETGNYKVKTTATASTYEEPVKTGTTTVNVENCWDVSMNVVPEVASAGENRSVVYEVQLENTGTQENTYELAYEGPEWVNIKPSNLTVGAGQTSTAYMYAGIPFKKEGNVQITATATGTNTTTSQTVELVIGKEIEEAIQDNSNQLSNGITGQFSQALGNLQTSGNLVKLTAAILLALVITAAILVREW